MNRFFNKKNLAFTLAEMMVVLAVFSVVSAATLPVMTARQQLTTEVAGAEGSSEDPWSYNSNYNALYYYNSSQPSTSAVMVGGQVTDTPASIGYPQLIVKDNFEEGSGTDDGSHIVLFRRHNDNSYYAGRIMLGGNSLNEGSVAIGANALAYNTNSAYRGYNVAIGSNAMNSDGGASTAQKSYNIAVGPNTLRGAKKASYTVAIGNYTGVGPKFYDTVLIGNYAGCAQDVSSGSVQIADVYSSVYIGDRAGYSPTGAGAGNKNVAIGTFSLFNTTHSSNAVAIGTYSSGSTTTNKTSNNSVAIGTYAGFNPKNNGAGTSIGYYAGAEANSGVMIGVYAGYNSENSIAIGHRAGYNSKNTTAIGSYAGYNASYDTAEHVFIGAYAGANLDNDGSAGNTYLPAVAIGNHAGDGINGNASYSIYIGNNAGYQTSTRKSVCIGTNACAGLGEPNAEGFVRISSKDGEWDDVSPNYNFSIIGDVPSAIKDAVGVTAPLNSSKDVLVLTPLYSNKTATTDSSIVLLGVVYSYKNSMTLFSDRRLKRDIVPTKYGLKDIRKINVYNYNWKSDDTKATNIGVIAQELQKVIPEGVHVDKEKNFGGYLTVNVEWLIYPMINAIKELDVQVQTIKKQVVAYSKEYVTLVERVNKLEKEVKVLEKENKILTRDVKVAYKKVKKAESLR